MIVTVIVKHQVSVMYTLQQAAALDVRRVNYIREKLDEFALNLAADVELLSWNDKHD